MANFADLWDADAETSVKSDFNSRLNAARNAWQAQTGKTLPVTSGYRTTEEQAKLFAQRGSNPNLVAKPGTSLHEKGEAADIPTNIPDSFLSQFGLHRPFGKKDPVHVQADPNFKSQVSAQPSSNFADLWESSQQAPEEQVKKPSGFMETMTAANKTNAPLAQSVASLADTVTGIIPSAISTAVYPVARAFQQSPEEATKIAQKLSEPFSQPFGKAFGVTESEAYKNEATRKAMDAIGQYVGEKADVIAQKTGIPKSDVENMLNTLSLAAGKGLEVGGKTIGSALKAREVPAAELAQFRKGVTPEQMTRPQMAGVGAATTENATILKQAIETASPELKSELAKIKPDELDVIALERQLEADSLGIQLTKGQATGNPTLISKERNERGYKEQFVNRFNEQNKALIEKTRSIKDEVAPDVFSQNYVVDADNVIANTIKKQESFDKDISAAYKELEDFGQGKIEVDSQTFGQNARKALLEKDDIDFLPVSFKNKLQEYIDGKSMNFNQFENLRSQTAKEIRKEQRADNGNAVHALTLFRGELEKLPLIGETVEAKIIADRARNLAKNQFDLLDKRKPTYNSFYADIVNGKADSSNFISKSIINSKNADFAKTLDFIGDDQITKQHIASGTLDFIIDKSTDASGNFMTKKFKDYINNLDTNGKLQTLFGEQAETLRKIARTGQLIEARPKGAFVNESNTFVAQAAELAKSGAEKTANVVLGGGIVPVGSMVREAAQRRAATKATQESLKPGAGIKKTKLSDIGKE